MSVAERMAEGVRTLSAGARFLRTTGLLADLRPGGLAEMLRASIRNPGPDSIYRFHGRNSPRKVAVVSGGRRFTWAEMDRLIDRLARALLARGIGPGRAAAIGLRNRVEAMVAQAALHRIGAAAVSLPWRSTADELVHALGSSGARAFFFESEVEDRMREARGRLPRLSDEGLVAVGERVAGLAAFEDLIAVASPTGVRERDGGSVVTFTSGTTGKPKAAVRRFGRSTMLQVFDFVCETPFANDERHLVVCPLYHSAAFAFSSLALLVGGTVFLEHEFEARSFLEIVARERITSVVLVPTMLHRLLALPAETRTSAVLGSLRAIYSAAAPLSPDLAIRTLRSLGPVLFNFYGATETGIVTLARPDDLARRPDTVGRRLPGNDIRLLDENGREVAPGEVGEIWVRSPEVVHGYHADDAATRESMRDGYFTVGDLARCDDEGLHYVVGRKRELIISGGVNVHPREVETCIEEHPAVAEAAVVGVPDEEWGERVRAFVVLLHGQVADAETLLAHCRKKLSAPKVPRDVRFLPDLPRNETGKVLKRELARLD